MSEKHEWLEKDVVCIDNSNKTRHLKIHHGNGARAGIGKKYLRRLNTLD